MDEFEDLFKTFQTDARAALFKFMDLFGFQNGFITFQEFTANTSSYADLKAIVKHAKKVSFLETTTDQDVRRLLWFFCQKVMEAKDGARPAFEKSARREITLWADMCIERTYEGKPFIKVVDGGSFQNG